MLVFSTKGAKHVSQLVLVVPEQVRQDESQHSPEAVSDNPLAHDVQSLDSGPSQSPHELSQHLVPNKFLLSGQDVHWFSPAPEQSRHDE